MTTVKKSIIGTNVLVQIAGVPSDILAKVDTGADGTAIWASNIYLDADNKLHFCFFDKESPLFTGEEQIFTEFEIIKVSSSTGHGEFRFRVKLPIRINDRLVNAWCSLTDRSRRTYPMLIGKRTLKGKFLVDVSKFAVKMPSKDIGKYTHEFHKNPQAFIEKNKEKIIMENEV